MIDSDSILNKKYFLSNNISYNEKHLKKLSTKKILVKFGGNAILKKENLRSIIQEICSLKEIGMIPIIVHGGGSSISQLLNKVGIKSEFFGGHRRTSKAEMKYIEMVLKGDINGRIVKSIISCGIKAVGLSGKDGGLVKVKKRKYLEKINGKLNEIDLGQVGDIKIVNSDLLDTLIKSDYIPVLAPIGYGEDFEDYNVNADMFAGHIATALRVDYYIALTDMEGILKEPGNTSSLISKISIAEVTNWDG